MSEDRGQKILLPWVTSGEGGVTAHEEADQQSEYDKFCLTLHLDLNVWIKLNIKSFYINQALPNVRVCCNVIPGTALTRLIPGTPLAPSVSVSVEAWHLWPDAVSAPAPPTSERSMNEPHTKIHTSSESSHPHLSWRELSHKYRSGQIPVPSLNYNETIYLLPCSFLFKFRWMNALHKSM